ncbi:MAG: exo-alpha-sialidase [bacterium]|nr:exo-alpha-sialidase [bacterium]
MSERIRVATRKGLFTVERDTSGKWNIAGEPAFLGDPVTIVLDDPRDGTLYAALNLGHFGVKLRRSSDDGKTWDELDAPSFPAESGEADAPSTHQVWALEPGGADQPGVLWAGAIPAGLFRSTDGGDSWQLVRSLWDRPERKQWFGGGYDDAGIHSIVVDPRDSRRVLVGISCGGVWVTTDGGETWDCTTQGMYAEYMPPEKREDPAIQDPHRMVACAADPDRLWVQHHNGVFRSDDGGARWNEVTAIRPAKFGFAVAVHPQRPDTAWFVPGVKDECRVPVDARVVVARTTDGGGSFDLLGRGLPEEPAYDLVFRHALDIDAAGDRLAFGSTTGSLWVTEDGGESWVAVSQHLPPVYQVRFV